MEQQPKISEQNKRIELLNKIIADYEKVFGTPEGMRVLEDLKKSSHINKTSFNVDTHIMAYNEGARTTVLHIMDMSKPKPRKDVQAQAIRGGSND
jgi:hypothetical protein